MRTGRLACEPADCPWERVAGARSGSAGSRCFLAPLVPCAQDRLLVPEDAPGRLAAETAANGADAVIVRRRWRLSSTRACGAAASSAWTRGAAPGARSPRTPERLLV